MAYAIDVKNDRVVRVPGDTPRAEQDAYRDWVKASLRCVVDHCRAKLTVKFPTSARNHFAHMPGHGHDHSPESLWHHMGKAAIVHWARSYHPDLIVTPEASVRVGEEWRRPDVTITGTSGHRVFMEVQYADLKPELWAERHRDLTAGGDAAVWLLGHLREHAQVNRAGALKLSLLVRTMASAGVTPLWINPVAGEILTPFGPSDRFGPTSLNGQRVSTDLAPPQSLATCRLTPDGIVTTRLEQLRQAEEARAAARRAQAARDEEENRRRAVALEEAERHRERREAALRASPEFAWASARHGDPLPEFIRADERSKALGAAVGLSAVHWQVRIYHYLVEVSPAGEWVGFFDLVNLIGDGRPRHALTLEHFKTLRRLLVSLERASVIELRRQSGHVLIEAARAPLSVSPPLVVEDTATQPAEVVEAVQAPLVVEGVAAEADEATPGPEVPDASGGTGPWERVAAKVRRWLSR